MEEQRERWRRQFEKRGIPQPPGVLLNVRYQVSGDDWYAQVESGDWHWYDRRDRAWKHTINGPM